jgi:hypothetical protein
MPITSHQLVRLDELLASGMPLLVALPQAVGGTTICDGLWRLFSNSWPQGGISGWNSASPWKLSWQPFLPTGVFSFGEDVFGNQLILVDGFENAMVWNHENGESQDLFVRPCELLRTALESGIDWIDFYSDGSLAVARQYGAVPLQMHLHWTTPLILGGPVSKENLTLVEREAHLVGHAQLWSQISGLPPGTTIISAQ